MNTSKRAKKGKDDVAAAPKPINISGRVSEDWIESLAKKSSSEMQVASKEQRVERRLAKKRRRDERKAPSRKPPSNGSSYEKEHKSQNRDTSENDIVSRKRLRIIAAQFENFQTPKAPSSHAKSTRTNARVHSKINSKAKWNESSIQPRYNDYGGIGLARPSLFVPLNDPSFIPKLENEFAEHIPGFFGKQRTKAMKKQLNGQMLWRKLADNSFGNQKVNGKKIATMSPDERVEALLKAGAI